MMSSLLTTKGLAVIVFNIWYYLAFLVSTIVVVLFYLPILIVTRIVASHRNTMRVLRGAIRMYGKICLGLAWPYIRIKFRDLSETETKGPFIYVCNHRSSSDPFLMACLNSEAIQVVNMWPFKLPLLGPLAKLAGYLSVREMPFEEFKIRTKELLDQGVSIIIFPEGTRSGDKQMGSFHGAIFRVCLETGTSIVPLCIMGNENKPPRGSLLMRPGIIKIDRLEAITADQYTEMSSFKLKNRVRTVIMNHIDSEEEHNETD